MIGFFWNGQKVPSQEPPVLIKIRECVSSSTAIEWTSLDYLSGHWEYDLNLNITQLKFLPLCKRKMLLPSGDSLSYEILSHHCQWDQGMTTPKSTKRLILDITEIIPLLGGLVESRHSLSCSSWSLKSLFTLSLDRSFPKHQGKRKSWLIIAHYELLQLLESSQRLWASLSALALWDVFIPY